MVFNLVDADMSKFPLSVSSASTLWDYGTANYDSNTKWYFWECGTQRNNRDAVTAWNYIMKDYAPFKQAQPLSSLMGGFTISELVQRGYYTAGTTKAFYLDEDLTEYIKITTSGTSTDGWNYTTYTNPRVSIKLTGQSEQQLFSISGSVINLGLVNGSLNNVHGYYLYYQSNMTRGGHLNVDIYALGDTEIARRIRVRSGKAPTPPTVDPDKEPLGNWDGDFNPEGDTIDMPTDPDETISGALANGFLNVYAPSASQLQAFGGLLWTNAFNVKWYDYDSVSQLILNTVSDPINFIVGLFMIPVTPNTTSSNGIYLGGINANTVTPPRVTKQFKTIDFGTIEISELYGNYLDYSNTRVAIYLPYVGTADIDIQEIAGGSITLQYTVDCFTGSCVANVKCVKTTETPWGKTYTNETVHSYSGNVAIQLPISAGSFDTMMQGLVNIGLGLGTNTPAVVMQGMTQSLQGFSGDVTTRGSLSSNTGKLCYQTPYLMFTRPIESLPNGNASLHGYGAGTGGKLSKFSGYVEVSDVKLDGIPATENELTMIESLLKGGVYV